MKHHLRQLTLAALVAAAPGAVFADDWQTQVGEALGKTGSAAPGGIYRVGLPRIGKIDRADGDHLGRGMVRRRAGNHDHGGDAAEARKRQAFDHLIVGHDFVGPGLQLAVDALDPERMPECHRFASRPRQAQLPRVGAAPADSMRIESLSRYPPAFVANRVLAATG